MFIAQSTSMGFDDGKQLLSATMTRNLRTEFIQSQTICTNVALGLGHENQYELKKKHSNNCHSLQLLNGLTDYYKTKKTRTLFTFNKKQTKLKSFNLLGSYDATDRNMSNL